MLVIGVGELGSALVDVLWEGGAEVVAIDVSAEAVEGCRSRTSAAYVGDGSDPRVLESIGAAEMDAAVVTYGEHFEASVLCVSALVRLGVPNVVARASTDRKADVLRALGAHRVLRVEREMGRRVGAGLLHAESVELWDLAAGYRIIPWVVTGPFAGQTLADMKLRRLGVSVLGLWPRGVKAGTPGTLVQVVEPNYQLLPGDTLLMVGPANGIDALLSETAAAAS